MKKLLIIFVLCAGAISVSGQKKVKVKAKYLTTQSNCSPPWALAQHYTGSERAYLADYYVYYDCKRGGYVYLNGNSWSFSPAVTPYLQYVNVRNSRLKLTNGLSIEMKPELSYPRYMKWYPIPLTRDNDLAFVPVPVPGNP
jgi:hypothetical protein